MDIPDDILERMNAGAFQSLCEHLRARSDLVQNMTLMTISGFCRNCLAKVSCLHDVVSNFATHTSALTNLITVKSGWYSKHGDSPNNFALMKIWPVSTLKMETHTWRTLYNS